MAGKTACVPEKHAVEIRGEHPAPLGERQLLERGVRVDARVVDEDVDAAVFTEHLIDGRLDIGLIGDVDRIRVRVLTDLPSSRFGARSVAIE